MLSTGLAKIRSCPHHPRLPAHFLPPTPSQGTSITVTPTMPGVGLSVLGLVRLDSAGTQLGEGQRGKTGANTARRAVPGLLSTQCPKPRGSLYDVSALGDSCPATPLGTSPPQGKSQTDLLGWPATKELGDDWYLTPELLTLKSTTTSRRRTREPHPSF